MKRSTLSALLAAGSLALCAIPTSQAAEQVIATNLEPLHHVILENQYVTVMRVMLRPGESTMFHEQHLDYVNTHVNGSLVNIAYPDKPAKDTEMKSGNVKFGAHQGKSETDKVTNTGTTLNHQVSLRSNRPVR